MKLFLIIFGISCGLMVGSGVIGILILVGIIPRMAQISKTKDYIGLYECLLIIGTFIGSLISIQNLNFKIGWIGAVVFGLCYGVFVGFLSSGIAEVLDYIPIICRRVNISTMYFKYIIICLLIGKVIGSLIGWTIIQGG